jgi:prepilin-type N-terminal cleavage/methylation domain-containing protein
MRKGFTLIEIIMVIVIIAVLAAIALPRFLNLRKQAEETVAKHFGAVLKEAYSHYIMRLAIEGKPTSVPSFNSFVGFSEGASDRNTIKIDAGIRAAFADPNANVGADTVITFNFKSGSTAVYTFDPAKQTIQQQFTP